MNEKTTINEVRDFSDLMTGKYNENNIIEMKLLETTELNFKKLKI